MKNTLLACFACVTLLFNVSCSESGKTPAQSVTPNISKGLDISLTDPVNDDDEVNQEEIQQNQIITSKVLLFNGIGTSPSDVESLKKILQSSGLTYRLVNSAALTAISLADLKLFKLILIPGGNSNFINNNLSVSTRIKVRQAVRDGGVSFLGICAGAFAAVGIDTASNSTAYYGFGVAQGDYLVHWYPNGNSSLIAAVPKIRFADGMSRYLMWWDGPATPEWRGGVVARYPDGKPAISQTWTGKGFVIVSGPHPEAPTSWQYESGNDPDGTDFDIAANLIRAALNRNPLPTY